MAPRTALAADFAKQLNLREGKLHDAAEAAYRSPRRERCQILKPGRSTLGSFYSAIGTSIGLAITDPTADPRVLEYCLSVPDHIFIDPETGVDRWLIREAMKGRLPEEVRLNRRLGRQSGDLVPRLRASRDEVEAALDECAHGPSAGYLDVAHMRRVWDHIQCGRQHRDISAFPLPSSPAESWLDCSSMASARPGSDPGWRRCCPFGPVMRIAYGEVPTTFPDSIGRGLLYDVSRSALLLEIPDIARLHITRDAVVVAPLMTDAAAALGPHLRRTPLMALTLLAAASPAAAPPWQDRMAPLCCWARQEPGNPRWRPH